MAALDKIIMMVLRAFQLVGAVVVIGLSSKFISSGGDEDTEYNSRFIVAVIVSVISAFFGFIWLLPFSSNHMNYYIDGFLAVANAAVTAWIMWGTNNDCGSIVGPFDDGDLEDGTSTSDCEKWRALYGFTIFCTVLWFLTAIIGCTWVKRNTVKPKTGRKGRR